MRERGTNGTGGIADSRSAAVGPGIAAVRFENAAVELGNAAVGLRNEAVNYA